MRDGPRSKLSHQGDTGFSRRAPLVAVVVAVALVASMLGPSVVYAVPARAETPVQLAGGERAPIPAGELGGPFTAASVRSAEEVLAGSGIATVANETSKAPLVGVNGPVRFRFTRAQVQAFAIAAADGGGIPGSALDAVGPLTKGLAPFSYVLASWVRNEATPGAEAVRALMGPQDWRRAPSLIFPTIDLPLFVADVIAHTPPGTGGPGKAATAAGATRAEQAMDFFDAPCSTVSNFVQDTLVSVFDALKLTPAAGGGPGAALGNFFVTLWNGVVALAQQVVQGLINKVSQYIVSKIRLAAGAVVIIANIVAYLNPWSVKVTGIPNPLVAGGIGMFSAKVDTSNGISAWPPALVDCLPAGGRTAAPRRRPRRRHLVGGRGSLGHLRHLDHVVPPRPGPVELRHHGAGDGERLPRLRARPSAPERLGHHHRHPPRYRQAQVGRYQHGEQWLWGGGQHRQPSAVSVRWTSSPISMAPAM